MKRFFLFTAIIAIFAMFSFNSCKKQDQFKDAYTPTDFVQKFYNNVETNVTFENVVGNMYEKNGQKILIVENEFKTFGGKIKYTKQTRCNGDKVSCPNAGNNCSAVTMDDEAVLIVKK